MQQSMSHERRAALLSELGIVSWRARSGQVFPGAGVLDAYASEFPESSSIAVPKNVALPMANVAPVVVDILIHADTHSVAEAELLARIIQAAHGLRAGMRIEHHALDAAHASTQVSAQISLRLDDLDLPSPASMLANPGSKRPLWQALQNAVARLP